MFWEFFRFELRFQLRSPLLWIFTGLFALLAGTALATDAVTVGSAIGNVNRNAPAVVLNFLAVFSILGLLVVVSFVASGLLRDHELGTAELFFASPMNKRDFLFGRMAGGLCASLVVFLGIALAMSLAQFWPGLDPERIGPYPWRAYLYGLGVIVLPDLLFIGGVLGVLAATTRTLLGTYVGVIAFFTLWTIATALSRDLESVMTAVMVDPFGGRALSRAMRYWSAAERNTQIPDLYGYVLANRALWTAVAIGLYVATYALFKPMRTGTASAKPVKGRVAEPQPHAVAAAVAGPPSELVLPGVSPRHDRGAARAQFRHLLGFETRAVLSGIPFRIMLAFGMMNLGFGAVLSDILFGTKVLPVTHLMLDAIRGSFTFMLWVILVFYAGELIFRERSAKLSEVTDALPVPNWVPLAAKFGALLSVIVCFLAVGALTTIGVQLARGYYAIEALVYVKNLALDAWLYTLIAAFAFAVQVFCNQRFLGYAIVVGVLLLQALLPAMHLEHNLYSYASAPEAPYSDMNGFGHFLTGWSWFMAYWSAAALALLALAAAFWVRGSDPARRERLAAARARLRGPAGLAFATATVAFVALGAWIYYNTTMLNEFLPSNVALDRQARYERDYRQYAALPQPRITHVRADVDLHPHERRAEIRGTYHLVNKSSEPIREFHVLLPRLVQIESLEFGPHRLKQEDLEIGYRIYELDQPMAPGAELDFAFKLRFEARGFTNDRGQTQLLDNGTFFNSRQAFPSLGYQERFEIEDRNERRKRDLGEPRRMPKLEDEAARANTYVGNDADWIDFETTVSTVPDQIALAPGVLQREWSENGRRYFHYRMDRPMLPMWAYLSADWQVRKDRWNDVAIEIYYDAKHPANVERMVQGVKDTLAYTEANFTPYQHKEVRIVEFPRYASFAQSFAGTFPYSESIGFIADLRDPDAIDYVYYVIAHETAHQWWAHQVIGANVQGATVMSESLSQYTAQMVMEHEYGPGKMRRFLKYELDRYLSSRGGELLEELPLYRVENQPYIHYRKGSMVFYRLKDEIGEAPLNRALKRYLEDKGYQQPPYTTSKELLEYIRAETPADKQDLVTDLFEKITFYDNRITEASAVKRDDGRYDVTLKLHLDKRYADGKGVETPAALGEPIEIGVFARKPGAKESEETVLLLEKRALAERDMSVTVTVDAEPYEAGVDPYNKLIDRVSADNRKRVTLK